ncbi:hypothetical protein [Streptomyces sp. NPDC048639]
MAKGSDHCRTGADQPTRPVAEAALLLYERTPLGIAPAEAA